MYVCKYVSKQARKQVIKIVSKKVSKKLFDFRYNAMPNIGQKLFYDMKMKYVESD